MHDNTQLVEKTWLQKHMRKIRNIGIIILAVFVLFCVFANEWIIVTFATKVELGYAYGISKPEFVEVSRDDKKQIQEWVSGLTYDLVESPKSERTSIRFSILFFNYTYYYSMGTYGRQKVFTTTRWADAKEFSDELIALFYKYKPDGYSLTVS